MTAAIPMIYSIDSVGGQAARKDLLNALSTTAPCRFAECEKEGRAALDKINLCRDHFEIVTADLTQTQVRILAALGRVTEPLNLIESPPNLPDVEFE